MKQVSIYQMRRRLLCKNRFFFFVVVVVVVVAFVFGSFYSDFLRFEDFGFDSWEADDEASFPIHSVNFSVTEFTFGNETKKGFDVFTPGCRIPTFDPFDPSLSHIKLKGKEKTIECSKTRRFVVRNLKENSIRLNEKEIKGEKLRIKSCEIKTVKRRSDSDSSWEWTDARTFRADASVNLSGDFSLIICFDKDRRALFQEFVVAALDDKTKDKETKDSGFDVLLIGVDSVSRNNFVRNFPKTRKFLFDNLEPVEYFGYNKVADNTLVNFIPFLTGKYLKDLPWTEKMAHLPFDKYPFIWKNFSDRGYRTFFGEDSRSINTFNYQKAGFHSQPTDYYFRPFMLAHEELEKKMGLSRESRTRCFGYQTQGEWLYDYFLEFLRTHKNEKKFALVWTNSWSHAEVYDAALADEPTEKLFHKLKQGGFLENSIVIFFSDHGFRFGQIRETFAGKFEERLPFLFFLAPKRFKKDHRGRYENLKKNARRLTTNFDIYQTLVDLLDLGSMKETRGKENSPFVNGIQYRYSLLDEVPLERNCESATIKPHWCVCQSMKQVDVKDKDVTKAGQFIVQQINKYLSVKKDVCEHYSMKNIKSAFVTESSEYYLKFKSVLNDVLNRKFYYQPKVTAAKNYVIIVEVGPGRGVFEGTVRVWEKNNNNNKMEPMKLEGEVSRINLYGNDSHCVKEANLKKFCYCKIQSLNRV